MARITVVGAGVAGLAVAARLAALGHRVTVLDRHQGFGGVCSARQWQGHTFDNGPDCITMLAGWRDLFLATGRPLEESVTIVDAPLAGSYRFADGTVLDLPGAGVSRTTIAIREALGDAAAQQWASYLANAGRIWSSARGDVTVRQSTQPWRLWQQRRILNRKLRMLLERRCAGWGEPAGLGWSMLLPYLDAAFGVHHLAGGINKLAGALHQRCDELGVHFRWEMDVQRRPDADVVVWSSTTERLPVVGWQQHLAVSDSMPTPDHWAEWLDEDGSYLRICAPSDAAMHPAGSRAWTLRSNRPDPIDRLPEVGINVRSHLLWCSEVQPLHAAGRRRNPTPHWAQYRLDQGGPGLPMVALAAQRIATDIGSS